jgi:Zn-dependent oligopeptidase
LETLDQISNEGMVTTRNKSHPGVTITVLMLHFSSSCHTVCSVIDAAELCRNVHFDIAYRAAAEEAFSTLSTYINRLNANMSIFQHLKSIVTGPAGGAGRGGLSAEEGILAADMLHELETEGGLWRSHIHVHHAVTFLLLYNI